MILADYIVKKGMSISSTLEDLQGETRSKETLEMLVKQLPERLILNSQHNLAKTTQSYIENFSLIPIEGSSDWKIIGDLHLHKDDVSRESEMMGGLSISYITTTASNSSNPLFKVFLPFPYYNDEVLTNSILKSNAPLVLGKWHKKELSPTETGIIISALTLVISPFANSIYDVFIKEHFENLLGTLKSLCKKNLHYDLSQSVEFEGKSITLIFLSNKGDWQTALDPINIQCGTETAIEFLRKSDLAQIKQVTEMRMLYNKDTNCFSLIILKYEDGENLSIPA